MTLLYLLSWPYFRKHKLRSLLTLAGIVIGVSVFVGMHAANRAVSRAFQQTVVRVAGAAELQVSSGETGFPEEVLEQVQSLAEVRAAAPVIEAVADTGIPGQGSLLILGVDMTGDRSLRDYDLEEEDGSGIIDDPLIFLAQPDSIILSERFAARNGVVRGGKLSLRTMQGPREFTVRGIMRAGGLASAFGGNVAVMDVYAAQLVFGRGRMFDRIDVGVREGVPVEECRDRLSRLLGPGLQVEAPAARAGHFDLISRGLSITINISSLFALLIGIFIIYNSFAIAITERRAEIGVLRALGASRGRVMGMFVAESVVGGILGSCLGVGLGLVMANGIAPHLSSLVHQIYGKAQQAGDVSSQPSLLLLAAAMGVAASAAGGLLPARRAARVDPVKALHRGQYQVLSAGENRARTIVGIMAAGIASLCLLFGRAPVVFYAGYILVIVSLLLFSPALAQWLARSLRPLLKMLRPVEGVLAADSLIQAPRRTSATVSAVMLSLALAVGFAGVSGAIYSSVLTWIDNRLNPDLFVAPTQNIASRDFRFQESLGDELRALEEVEEVQAVRSPRIMLGGIPTMAVAVPFDSLFERVPVVAVEGDPDEMRREGAAGTGIIISDSMANMRGIRVGDYVDLAAPGGNLSLRVLGTSVDYSDQQGSFLIDRSVYRRYWRDDTVNVFRVYLRPGVDQDRAKEKILATAGAGRRMFVFTNAALRDYVLETTAQWFGLTYIQLAVALLVAVLGIVNTLTVSITDRRRELGILQAVGALRGQVRLTIWMEALAIGCIGLLLGLAMGAVTLYYNLGMLRLDIAGLHLDYQYPILFAAFLLPLVLGAAFLASLWPAEAAVRGSLVESLEYE